MALCTLCGEEVKVDKEAPPEVQAEQAEKHIEECGARRPEEE